RDRVRHSRRRPDVVEWHRHAGGGQRISLIEQHLDPPLRPAEGGFFASGPQHALTQLRPLHRSAARSLASREPPDRSVRLCDGGSSPDYARGEPVSFSPHSFVQRWRAPRHVGRVAFLMLVLSIAGLLLVPATAFGQAGT